MTKTKQKNKIHPQLGGGCCKVLFRSISFDARYSLRIRLDSNGKNGSHV